MINYHPNELVPFKVRTLKDGRYEVSPVSAVACTFMRAHKMIFTPEVAHKLICLCGSERGSYHYRVPDYTNKAITVNTLMNLHRRHIFTFFIGQPVFWNSYNSQMYYHNLWKEQAFKLNSRGYQVAAALIRYLYLEGVTHADPDTGLTGRTGGQADHLEPQADEGQAAGGRVAGGEGERSSAHGVQQAEPQW